MSADEQQTAFQSSKWSFSAQKFKSGQKDHSQYVIIWANVTVVSIRLAFMWKQ